MHTENPNIDWEAAFIEISIIEATFKIETCLGVHFFLALRCFKQLGFLAIDYFQESSRGLTEYKRNY